jgi:serine/threonine protein kinase
MEPIDRMENGLYILTGNTGSLRYMAPEVAKGEPYDQRVDTYSFGVLFWQICSLQTPYAGMSTKMHAEKVVQQGQRPNPDRSWPLSWVDIMRRAWDPDMTKRLDFDEITVFLDQQVEDMRSDDGEIPSRAAEIKATKRNRPTVAQRLDVDTRISTSADGPNVKKYDQEVL